MVDNIFSPTASRVIRCLLVNIGKNWTIRELAKEANTSVGYTHAIIATLERMEYVVRTEELKLALMNPLTLIRRWAAHRDYNYVNDFLDYYTFDNEIESVFHTFERNLKNEDYSVTSLAGAWLVSGYVRPIDIHLYIKNRKDAERISQLLDIKPTAGKGNIRMVIPDDSGVFYGSRIIQGVKVVSNIQLFVDLQSYPTRGEEAAQNLYNSIEKRWIEHSTGELHV
ncbi:MAG: type IV toxin-antitoxin system AbiEi family antitoxin [Candidatus Thorarchaeota archaeon]